MSGPITTGEQAVPDGAARRYFPDHCEAKLAAVSAAVSALDDALALAGWRVDERLVAGSAAASTAVLENAIDPGWPVASERILSEARVSAACSIFMQLLEPCDDAMRRDALVRLCLISTPKGRAIMAETLEPKGET